MSLKRQSPPPSSPRPSKTLRTSNLDTYFLVPPPAPPRPPHPSSHIFLPAHLHIRDRDSYFTACASICNSPDEAGRFQKWVRWAHGRSLEEQKRWGMREGEGPGGGGKMPVGEAGHQILAWRCMGLKRGKSGIGENGEEDWEVKEGGDNDGEERASPVLLSALRSRASLDICIIVSRWFGGTLLGPVRFEHIKNVSNAIIDLWEERDQLDNFKRELAELDDVLEGLVGKGNGKSGAEGERYKDLKVEVAPRLIMARKKRIVHLRRLRDQPPVPIKAAEGTEKRTSEVETVVSEGIGAPAPTLKPSTLAAELAEGAEGKREIEQQRKALARKVKPPWFAEEGEEQVKDDEPMVKTEVVAG